MKIKRASGAEEPATADAGATAPARSLASPFGVDETAELLLDLLERAALVQPDLLALVRDRASTGTPVTQALVDEGATTADGVARMLAARHHLQIVDLGSVGVGVDADAAHSGPDARTLGRRAVCAGGRRAQGGGGGSRQPSRDRRAASRHEALAGARRRVARRHPRRAPAPRANRRRDRLGRRRRA